MMVDLVPSCPMTEDRQPPPRAVIFDLGGTLVDWPDWNEDAPRRWALSWDALTATLPHAAWPPRDAYVAAMRADEVPPVENASSISLLRRHLGQLPLWQHGVL